MSCEGAAQGQAGRAQVCRRVCVVQSSGGTEREGVECEQMASVTANLNP